MTSSAESDLRRPARTSHQSCVPRCSRFDGHCKESATHAIRDSPQHKRDLARKANKVAALATMARRRWYYNKRSPVVRMVSCNQHKLTPMQRITQLEFGQSSNMLRRSARHCYKSSLSSQPESTAPWYDAWSRMRPHRCHFQAPSESICGWLPLPWTVGVSLEQATRSRAGYAVSVASSMRCLNT